MNPFEVGNLEPHKPEAGLLFQLSVAINIIFRVAVGIAILALIAFALACALVYGLPPES